MTSNQTLFARHETSTKFYELKYVGSNSNVGFIINQRWGHNRTLWRKR